MQLELFYNDQKSIQDTKGRADTFKVLASFVNAAPDEIVLGPTSSQLFRNLTNSLRHYLNSDSEMIVSTLCHEAGISAWVSLANSVGITIKWWTPPSSSNPRLCLSTLKSLLTPKTRLVTCGHISNILGSIHPIREIADLVHTVPGALLSVDGVAWAPHRPIDVKALDVDFYTFSWYKVFGPHIAQMYARRSVQNRAMTSLNHYFLDSFSADVKLRIGQNLFELEDCLPAIVHYINETGWDNIIAHETVLTETLLAYLRSKPEIYTICGDTSSDPERRVSLITFRVAGRSSEAIADEIHDTTNFRVLWGDGYSARVAYDVLKLPEDGVVRVSLVHYNTVEEVKGFIEALDTIVSKAKVAKANGVNGTTEVGV